MRIAQLALLRFSVVALALVAASPTWGQSLYDSERKISAPGTLSQSGDIDSVSLLNGNLTLKVPLLHLAGRGIDTDIVLTYNAKLWKSYIYFDPYGWPGRNVWTDLEPDPAQGTALGIANGVSSQFVPFVGWRLGVPRMGEFATSSDDCQAWDQSAGLCQLGYLSYVWVQNDGTRTTLSSETVINEYNSSMG